MNLKESSIEWYYSQTNQKFGPVTFEKLQQMVSTGELKREDHVWKDGFKSWVRAGEVQQLFDYASSMNISTENNMDNFNIAFIESCRFENDSTIRGAVLVTDVHTKPLEFRVTAPIRPTPFQKTLYGDILFEHILVELVGIPLLKALKEKPNIVLVRDHLFLGVNEKQGIPVVRLFKEAEVQFGNNKNAQPMTSLSGKFEPIMTETSKNIEAHLPEIRKQLIEVFKKSNLLEPFERIRVACSQVHSQRVGES